MATPFPANGGSQASTRSVTLYPPKKRPLYGAGPCAGQTTARALVRLRDGRNSNNSRASGLLSSWKNIAAYLDRGVRTVQRWETTLGLPVHRMSAGQLAPVFAYEREIDLWLVDRICRGRRGYRRPACHSETCGYCSRPESGGGSPKRGCRATYYVRGRNPS